MIESETPKKKKIQEQMDIQMARQLEEEMEREAQRMNKQIARDVEIARIHAEDELQIMNDGLDMSNETVAKYLQEYHQFASELPIGRRIELISDLVKYQDNHAKVLKYQTQQRKPLTRKQQREFYALVLRNQAGWKAKHFKGMTLEEIKEKFDSVCLRLEPESVKKFKTLEEVKATEEVSKEKVKEMMQLVPIKEIYVEALQVKHPIIDWKNMMHAPVEWKLYDSCGVHHVTSKDNEIFMLIEKDYPLRKGLGRIVRNKMHKAFPLPVMEFPLSEEVPTASEESSHCQKKREATAEKIVLLLKNNCNCNIMYKDSLSYKRSPLVIVEHISISHHPILASIILKRRRDDDDDDQEEGPSAGSDRGSKRRREDKEPESASAPLETATRSEGRSAGKSTQGSKSRQTSASKSAAAKEPMQTTFEMEEPSHLELVIGADDQRIVESSQHPEWFSQQKKPPTPDRDWNKTLSATYGSIQPWISELAKQSDSRSSFYELMDTPVKEQVKVQVTKILPMIEQTVNEQLEAKVLTRSSNSSKASYAIAADLFEMDLKKILIEKIKGNKSIHRSNEQRNLYKALIEAYESDKIILDTYGDTVTLKRCRDDDADKDEEPSAGSDRGSKRRREGKEPESASAPTEKATRSAGNSAKFFNSGITLYQQWELVFIRSGKLLWQWELITASGNALCILFLTILPKLDAPTAIKFPE
nr:hypothetical protein [Tanacetum cinerariifolium]